MNLNLLKMKSYNKKKSNISLILGIIWILIGTTSIIGNSENDFLSGFLFIGIAYLAIYFMQRNVPYVLITDEFIQVCNFKKKKIYLKYEENVPAMNMSNFDVGKYFDEFNERFLKFKSELMEIVSFNI